MQTLISYGWTDELTEQWQAGDYTGLTPARVVADFGTSVKLATPAVIRAELSGKLAHHSSRELTPKIGDWVAVKVYSNGDAVVERVIFRRNEIARRAAGNRTLKQIIAANVDIAFVLLSVDKDFSIERLRRFMYQLSVGKIRPVIVLNKTDKTEHLHEYTEQLTSFGVPIVTMAAIEGSGAEELLTFIEPASTAILLGSSGVGKSTLTNLLLGRDTQRTQATRESDDTGKHTTVHRELFVLPGGGLLIDTPGIRELQLWGNEADLDDTFEDVASLIARCKYTTCRHGAEEGCAIRVALSTGKLSQERYVAFQKMSRELRSLQQKHVVRAKRDKAKSRHSDGGYLKEDLNDVQRGIYE